MDAALKDMNVASQNFPTPKFVGSVSAGQFAKAAPKPSTSSGAPKPDPSTSEPGTEPSHSPSPRPSTSSSCQPLVTCPPGGHQSSGPPGPHG